VAPNHPRASQGAWGTITPQGAGGGNPFAAADPPGPDASARPQVALVSAVPSAATKGHAAQGLLDEGLVCGIYESPEAAARRADPKTAAGLLLDVAWSGVSASESCRKTRLLLPNSNVVVLAARDEGQVILETLRAGACGFHVAPYSSEGLRAAAHSAASGCLTLCPTARRDLQGSLLAGESDPRMSLLTFREREVLGLVAEHKIDKEIGDVLGMKLCTVRFHMGSILCKLGARNRRDAAAKLQLSKAA
jgi:DNA-binding NarL/FixJ family response regulator